MRAYAPYTYPQNTKNTFIWQKKCLFICAFQKNVVILCRDMCFLQIAVT